MKTLAKMISVLMIAVMAFGMIGCSNANKYEVKELQQHKGDMLVITGYPQEAMPEDMYERSIIRMKLTYHGDAVNPHAVAEMGVKVTDEEYMKIYNFCEEAVAKNKFANYSENVCDGTTYKFVYYDVDGNEHVIYDGYCYDNKELCEIKRLIGKYQLD